MKMHNIPEKKSEKKHQTENSFIRYIFCYDNKLIQLRELIIKICLYVPAYTYSI